MGVRSGISVGGHHPAIRAMHRSMALAEDIREEQEKQNMKIVTHRLPDPPAGHPWHEAREKAVTLGREFRTVASRTTSSDPERKRLLDESTVAWKVADELLEAWKETVRDKFVEIRESIGEGRWQAFWSALPDGNAMTAVLDKKLDEIRGITQ